MSRRSTFHGRTLQDVQKIVQSDDENVQDMIKKDKDELDQLRGIITMEVKQNLILKSDLKDLDSQIKLMVKQRITVKDILAQSQHLKSIKRDVAEDTSYLGKTKQLYEHLFDLLQQEPHYVARLARLASATELPTFIQVVIFTLYGDQYEPRLERYLLLMFENMLQAEFEGASDMGSFMRANSALTQLLSAYCRRGQGMALLKDVLNEPLSALAASTIDFEIDPVKVYATMIKKQELDGKPSDLPRNVDADVAIQHPDVKAMIEERTIALDQFVDNLFCRIVDNVQNIPFGIRWISRRMRELCMTKWSSSSINEVNSIVGGLCFLRYISPAIATPDALHIIDRPVSYRRNFVLISKCMQNLSNGVPFGGREAFMARMNPFFDRNREKLGMFFDELCNVDNLDDYMRLDIMYAVERSDQFITITINDMYHMHSVVEKYKDQIVDGSDDVLLETVGRLGPAPTVKVKREQDCPVNLIMGKCGHESSYALAPEPVDHKAYMALKVQLVDFLREQQPLPDFVSENYGFIEVMKRLKAECTARQDFKAVQAITDIIQLTGQLVTEQAFPTPEQIFFALTRDITKNVDLYHKTQRNLASARKLLEEIRAHRDEMNETLTIHMEYLENVERQGVHNANEMAGKVKKVKLPNKEFSHRELEEKRVIIESRIPLEYRKRLLFVFATADCLTFTVMAKYQGLTMLTTNLYLRDLLSKQESNEVELTVNEEVTLNVNLLMHLLNKHFIAESEKLKMKSSAKTKK